MDRTIPLQKRHPDQAPARDKTAPHKSQRRGMLRLRKLLDSATELFLEKGVGATTVDEIVARTGIAKGSFYHHFESKSALVQKLNEELEDSMDRYVADAVEACPKEALHLRLATFIRATIHVYVDTFRLYNVLSGGQGPMCWTMSGTMYMNNFVALLAQGTAAGLWSVKTPALAATMIFRGLHGVVDDIILSGGDPKAAVPQITELALRMVAAK